MTSNAPVLVIVEDSQTDLELAIHALRVSGVANEIVVARDGQEAIDTLLGADPDGNHMPALIMLDIKLPKLSGFEVLRRLRADPRYARTPIVVLTSSRQDPDIEEAYENGATSYIVKPIDFEQLTTVIRQIGYYWLVVNEQPAAARGAHASPG